MDLGFRVSQSVHKPRLNLEVEARAAGDAGVQDATDNAASSQSASESLLEGSLASQTLTQVQDALRRIEAATHGKCM
jgi:RNA polymerase-binding transcription factor DksA